MKVMILCAGRGERMRPLTDTTPKPLLKVQGVPLLVHVLQSLRRAGFHDLVINISQFGDQIMALLGDGSDYDLRIDYSIEETPLETAGGVIKALPLLGEKPILIVSGDIYTDFDFTSLRNKKLDGILAHCVMVENPPYHSKGDFYLNAESRLALEGKPTVTYGNIGVYHPALFAGRPIERIGIGALLREAIAKNLVTGEAYQGVWYNVGTPDELSQLNKTLSKELGNVG